MGMCAITEPARWRKIGDFSEQRFQPTGHIADMQGADARRVDQQRPVDQLDHLPRARGVPAPPVRAAHLRGELHVVGDAIPSQRSYYLVYPERNATLPALAAFRQWLLATCAQS